MIKFARCFPLIVSFTLLFLYKYSQFDRYTYQKFLFFPKSLYSLQLNFYEHYYYRNGIKDRDFHALNLFD